MLTLLKKISRISVSIRKFKVFQLALLVLAFLLTLNVLIEPLFIKELIDRILPKKSLHELLLFVLLLLGLYILRQIFDFLLYYTQTIFESRIYTGIQHLLLRKSITLGYQHFIRRQKGDLLALFNDDIHVIENFLSNSFMLAVRRILFLLIAAFFLFKLNYVLTLIALPLSFLVPVLLKIYNKKLTKESSNFRDASASIMSLLQDFINRVHDIFAIRLFDFILKRHENIAEKYTKSNVNLYTYQAKGGMLAEMLVRFLQVIIVFGLGGLYVIKEKWSLGSLIAYYTYIKTLQPQVVGLFNLGLSLSKISSSVNKLYEFLYLPAEEEPCKENITEPQAGAVELTNVTVKSKDRTIIKNFTIKINQGEKLLITGITGSGKSTLLGVILGIVKPTEGEVLLQGKNPQCIKDGNFLKRVGYVPQDIGLFETTILENILVGRKKDDKKLKNALRKACLEDTIKNLPKGIESMVAKDHIKLSGGEIQRILIARAIYDDPSLLIFDEATSHLDRETERKILQNILKDDKTVIMVSHKHNLQNEYKWDKIISLTPQTI